MKKRLLSFLMSVLMLLATSAIGEELVINSDASDPPQRDAWQALVENFRKANPDLEVKLNIFDRESYKTSLRNWLASEAPDVVFWYAGERLNTFVSRGLLEDVSDLWDANNLHAQMASSRSAVTFKDKQFGLPFSYYQWGVYYRKDIFDKHGLKAPTNWDELLKVSATLKQNGVTPFTIGTKYLWTAAGWFDYLNLRINGLNFHRNLTAGKVPYTDDRVKAVFEKWEELIRPGYYIDNHTSYSWQEAQPFMYQGKAAMYLMGNFMVPGFPPEVADNMSYFMFPIINPDIPRAEDAPTDLVAIPTKASNKKAARRFLNYVAQPEILRQVNDAIGQLSTHKESGNKDDRFLNAGFKILSEADGLAQFYDRDTNPEMAKIGMKGFQEFMAKPDRRDQILKRLERARKRIYK